MIFTSLIITFLKTAKRGLQLYPDFDNIYTLHLLFWFCCGTSCSSKLLKQCAFQFCQNWLFGSKVVHFEVLAPIFCWKNTILTESEAKRPILLSWPWFMSWFSFAKWNLYPPKSSETSMSAKQKQNNLIFKKENCQFFIIQIWYTYSGWHFCFDKAHFMY